MKKPFSSTQQKFDIRLCNFCLRLIVELAAVQINLNESYEMKEELEKENAHFKKMVTSLKQKLDKSKEANVMLKVCRMVFRV